MDTDKVVSSLSPLEKKILPLVSEHSDLKSLCSVSGLSEVEVMRALQWLQNKGLVSLTANCIELVQIESNGELYLEKGLPERRFLHSIRSEAKPLKEIAKEAGLNDEELNVCIGLLKKKASIEIDQGLVSLLPQGEKILDKEWLEDNFLRKVAGERVSTDGLSDEEQFAFEVFNRRKDIIKTSVEKTWYVELTKEGNDLKGVDLSRDFIEKLDSSIIKSGSWKSTPFRRYDVKTNVPTINRGKRHFVSQAIEYARRVWIEFGFKEMTGSILNTSFWNFDALFQPQDHPARDLQDTFFIKKPKSGVLPNSKLVDSVKAAHENGGNLNSTGWGYQWSADEAKKNVLRTHTTVLSARTLAALKKEDLPAKFFAVGKCFRNETVDWSHGFEFNQFEGIVVDPDANFKHLLGYLKSFITRIGFPKARFRPAYFPYTEMSVEIDAYHPVHKTWIELGGAGIFRPEVVIPLLGKDIPVLAWGPGLDRQMMEFYKITDLRNLHKNDIKQLREMKEWML